MAKILVTGAAGFIGFHLSQRLLARGDQVVGLDNLNPYYDPKLKEARLAQLVGRPGFRFVRLELTDGPGLRALCEAERFDVVVNLAAQAGVRYSIDHPEAYIESNLVGFGHVLESCHRTGVRHLVFASSSSVYGGNTHMPFSTHDNVDHPLSLYAATKKANELLAHSYAALHKLPCTGLRFFTVYGPWGRPDMALFMFTKAILAGEPIQVFNHGKMQRDFTYVDDIAEGLVRVIDRPAAPAADWNSERPDPGTSFAPYRIYNIGNHSPVALNDYISTLERELGRKAIKNYLPLQPGDVPATSADVADLQRDTGFMPATPITVGIPRFVAWYRQYYGVN